MKSTVLKTSTMLTVALLMNFSLSAFSQDRNRTAEEAQAAWEDVDVQQMLSIFSQDRAEHGYMSATEALAWVEENSEAIPQKSRADVLALGDIMLQVVVSSRLTPVQRYAFMVEHLNEVLTLDWSAEERAHLMELYNVLARNPSLFECNNAAMLENALLVWSTRGYELFGWVMYTPISIFASSVRMTEKAGSPSILHSSIEVAFALSQQMAE